MYKYVTDMGNSNLGAESVDISFCLPVYNVEHFLKACIESIVSECEGLCSYEIICVDDASKDDSAKVLESLTPSVPQIKLFRNEENHGVSFSRNRALSLAKGKYIRFVDPDDMLYPGALRILYNEIEKENKEVILADYITCDEDAEYRSFKASEPEAQFDLLTPMGEAYLPKSAEGNPMCAVWCGLFRRSFLCEHNLRFREGMIAQEDSLFYYEFSQKLQSVIKCSKPCYIYRQRKTSVMHQKNAERSKKYYLSMRIMYDVYSGYLESGDYRDRKDLLKKLHQMKQSIAVTLAAVPDTEYVKQELKELRKLRIYPYPFRTEVLVSRESIPRRIMFFLLPIKLFFLLMHKLSKSTYK